MKSLYVLTAAAVLWSAVASAELSTAEQKRVQEASDVVTELRNAGDKGVPEAIWKKAECIIVVPSVKKAALGIGGEYGKGVMSCRSGTDWTAPVFMTLAKGSIGFQIGAQANDLVLVALNRKGVERMLGNKVTLGTDASVAAGPIGRTGQAATDLQVTAEILSYSRSQGLFAGIDLSGGTLQPDKDANRDAYGAGFSPATAISSTSTVTVPAALQAFTRTLSAEVSATTGQR